MQEQVATGTETKRRRWRPGIEAVDIKTSIIVVVQNFEKDLANMYTNLIKGLERADHGFEVIFVDDGSTDNSWHSLKEIADRDVRIKLVRLKTTFGESAAFDAGLKQSVGSKIVFFATRIRINAAQISLLTEKLDEGHDLVMGWRFPRRDSVLNKVISRLFNLLIKWVAKTSLPDINSGVFAARREMLDDIPLYGNLNIFLPILATRRGYKVTTSKIEQLPGKFRQSRYVSEYIQRLLDLLAVIFLTRYSKKPLHFLGFIGTVFTLAGAGISIYLFIYRVMALGPIAGRPLLLLGVLLLVLGIQMVSIGLIGEMIIFTHAKEVKEYSIEEILD